MKPNISLEMIALYTHDQKMSFERGQLTGGDNFLAHCLSRRCTEQEVFSPRLCNDRLLTTRSRRWANVSWAYAHDPPRQGGSYMNTEGA